MRPAFSAAAPAEHAIALIGVGIAVPLILQLALGGGMAAFDPARMTSRAGLSPRSAVLRSCSAWSTSSDRQLFRFVATGLQRWSGKCRRCAELWADRRAARAAFTAAILFVIGIIGFLLFGGAFAPALLNGRQPNGSALAGMGFAMLILVPLRYRLLFIVWLAARLCCTGPIMADKRTFNVLTGLSRSWRITGAAQWKIFAYFILLGIAFW